MARGDQAVFRNRLTAREVLLMARFLCDAMLGSLARWLRLFGIDCAFECSADRRGLAARAVREQRWLLTRDRRLAALGPRTTLIRAEALEDQLREVIKRHDVRPEPSLDHARCSVCNGELAAAGRDEVADRVPPYVARTATRFAECAQCGRVFWPGTHTRRIVDRMERVCSGLRYPS